ncbi:MAG: hypothetical protein AAF799_16565 [Myxococcota bacterium]
MVKTMMYRVIGSIFVVVHTDAAPGADEWSEYLAYYRENAHGKATLVVTDGGGPNAKQRAMVNEFLEKTDMKPKIAICTDRRVTRGIVTALGWFNKNIRVYATQDSDIEEALMYLGVAGSDGATTVSAVRGLRQELVELAAS